MKKFEVHTRGSIEQINPKEPHIIISISDDAEQGRARVRDNSHTQDVLFLEFHDANVESNGIKLFSDSDATRIIEFYKRYRNEVSLVIAHCVAGQSRSPAVLAALQKIETGDDSVWFKTKTPNTLVYRKLLETAHEHGLIG